MVECVVTAQMTATRIGVSRPAGFGLDLRNSEHLRPLRKSILCFVSFGFRLQRAQNLTFRGQNVDLHRSDPQRSETPKMGKFKLANAAPCARQRVASLHTEVQGILLTFRCCLAPPSVRNLQGHFQSICVDFPSFCTIRVKILRLIIHRIWVM